MAVSVIQKSESNSRSFKNDLEFWARRGKIKKRVIECSKPVREEEMKEAITALRTNEAGVSRL